MMNLHLSDRPLPEDCRVHCPFQENCYDKGFSRCPMKPEAGLSLPLLSSLLVHSIVLLFLLSIPIYAGGPHLRKAGAGFAYLADEKISGFEPGGLHSHNSQVKTSFVQDQPESSPATLANNSNRGSGVTEVRRMVSLEEGTEKTEQEAVNVQEIPGDKVVVKGIIGVSDVSEGKEQKRIKAEVKIAEGKKPKPLPREVKERPRGEKVRTEESQMSFPKEAQIEHVAGNRHPLADNLQEIIPPITAEESSSTPLQKEAVPPIAPERKDERIMTNQKAEPENNKSKANAPSPDGENMAVKEVITAEKDVADSQIKHPEPREKTPKTTEVPSGIAFLPDGPDVIPETIPDTIARETTLPPERLPDERQLSEDVRKSAATQPSVNGEPFDRNDPVKVKNAEPTPVMNPPESISALSESSADKLTAQKGRLNEVARGGTNIRGQEPSLPRNTPTPAQKVPGKPEIPSNTPDAASRGKVAEEIHHILKRELFTDTVLSEPEKTRRVVIPMAGTMTYARNVRTKEEEKKEPSSSPGGLHASTRVTQAAHAAENKAEDTKKSIRTKKHGTMPRDLLTELFETSHDVLPFSAELIPGNASIRPAATMSLTRQPSPAKVEDRTEVTTAKVKEVPEIVGVPDAGERSMGEINLFAGESSLLKESPVLGIPVVEALLSKDIKIEILSYQSEWPDIISMQLFTRDYQKDARRRVGKKQRELVFDEEKTGYSEEKTRARKVLEVAKAGKGIYTFVIKNRDDKLITVDVAFILYAGESSERGKHYNAVQVPPGALLKYRFLLPDGVFWDDEDQFSGSIENSDTITKFNDETGLVWEEEKE